MNDWVAGAFSFSSSSSIIVDIEKEGVSGEVIALVICGSVSLIHPAGDTMRGSHGTFLGNLVLLNKLLVGARVSWMRFLTGMCASHSNDLKCCQ